MKSLILNAFAMHSPTHLNPGLTRYPGDKGPSYKSIHHWINLAQKLEAAKFHAIFFADVLGPYDVYRGPQNTDPVIPAGAQFPINDPLYAVPAMAAATQNIGFGVTASTTYENPYALARRFSTVDHLSGGRVGWNIVTSYLDSAARNFGLDTQIEHDERYRIADEYLAVVYKLWEGSWRDEPHADSGYADPKSVRQINHNGKYFSIPGPHLCEPSPQRTPFILQAGTSTAGKAFAATHAEAIFLHGQAPELVRPSVESIRAQATAKGRNAADINHSRGAGDRRRDGRGSAGQILASGVVWRPRRRAGSVRRMVRLRPIDVCRRPGFPIRGGAGGAQHGEPLGEYGAGQRWAEEVG